MERLLEHYQDLVDTGVLRPDEAQCAVVSHLAAIGVQLTGYTPPSMSSYGSFWPFSWRRKPPAIPRGAYIWGDVGRGKSMLMDLFYEHAPARKRRVHFHAFMEEVHQAVHAHRQRGVAKGDADPIPPLVANIVAQAGLLCVDEFQVSDIADAMILSRLFTGLFSAGLVLVATSNTAPCDLYRDGLNRALFLPFVAVLERHTDVLHLDGPMDYRLDKLAGQQMYLTPHDDAAVTVLDAIWQRLSGGIASAQAIVHKKRTIEVPWAAFGAARFTFADLCEKPLGAADYIKIAQSFHTLLVTDIPIITRHRRDAGRRFVHLVDALYEARVKLIASAAAPPEALCRDDVLMSVFARARSRLVEMRSQAYLALAHSGAGAHGSDAAQANTSRSRQ